MEKIFKYLNSRQDKCIHFGGGYILATVFPIMPIWGLIIAVIAGKAKEMYDYKHQDRHTYDKWDMYATWLGGLIGWMVLTVK